jgi:hypothetical protein
VRSFTLPAGILYAPVPTGLADRFAAIIDALCLIVAAHGAKDQATATLIALIWTRLRRRGARFAALLARFRAGTLPAPRPLRRRAPRVPSDRPPYVRLPRRPGWLLRMMAPARLPVAPYATYLRQLLDDPEIAALLAAAPQAARLLRPLLTALSTDPLPEILRPTPKPTPPAAAAPDRVPPPDSPDAPRPRRARGLRPRIAPSSATTPPLRA